MAHVWDKNLSIVEEFARRHGVPYVVDRPEEMVGKVEGVTQSGYKASFWSIELVKPFLEADAAALIDRRGAYSFTRGKKLLNAARLAGGVLHWGNNQGAHNATESLAWRSRALGGVKGILEETLQPPLTSKSLPASAVRPGPVPGQFFDRHGTAAPANHAAQFSLPAVLKLASMLETRKPAQTEEQLLGKLRIFLASCKSLLEGGRAQEVAALRGGWTEPLSGLLTR